MSFTDVFVARPVATTLATVAIALAGALAYTRLPVAALPQVDFPTISVSAQLPGASPETMAATVATPLERVLGRIPGLAEMTSVSSLGSTRVTLQFDLNRNADAVAREVAAAINAARSLLPSGMPSSPSYRKTNPSESPILILSVASRVASPGQMYDAASTLLAQRLSQVPGVGNVSVGGSALPAVRVQMDLPALTRAGLAADDVRDAISRANVNRPKGFIEDAEHSWQVTATDTLTTAAEYRNLIVRHTSGATVRVGDVAKVEDSVQDVFTHGALDGQWSVLVIVYRQAGANVIEVVDQIRALLPGLRELLPASMDLYLPYERTATIRASVREVQHALLVAIGLVVLVVFVFLRSARATLIPGVAVPVSLIGSFAVMYFCGHSVNNLTLMALTIATGFVVDDAVVVLENIARHADNGMPLHEAARKGTREVTFTVVSMSLSLVAVFIPILFMGGLLGRLFREFAIVLSAAILISLVISLTVTPTMCARLLRTREPGRRENFLSRLSEEIFQAGLHFYSVTLGWALRLRWLALAVFIGVTWLAVHLFTTMPRSFFPTQDGGMLFGGLVADQNISFAGVREKLDRVSALLRRDPAVTTVSVSAGSGSSTGGPKNTGTVFVSLKPAAERDPLPVVQARFRALLAAMPGVTLYLLPIQDLRIGARVSQSSFQYTLQSGDLDLLRDWEPRVREALGTVPEITDVSSDFQDKGSLTRLVLDREAMARTGVTMRAVDDTLYCAFGQRIVSTIYGPMNQYRVILEAAQKQDPAAFEHVRVRAQSGALVPLNALARWEAAPAPLSVSHEGQFAALTFSFNLAEEAAFSDATRAINETLEDLGIPEDIQRQFSGTAGAYRDSLESQPLLIGAALLVIYLLLGVLYESFIHPLTILSTLPSAGLGALLALKAAGLDFSLMALIGVFLLIGIVKKNAIMMIDFALEAERQRGRSPAAAIHEACLLRLRPILMTSLAALLGALPLMLGTGVGAELRSPLGISIVGGLVVSQALTLYTTPVIYLLFDQLRHRLGGRRRTPSGAAQLNRPICV
jgi:multidrug efflux pump